MRINSINLEDEFREKFQKYESAMISLNSICLTKGTVYTEVENLKREKSLIAKLHDKRYHVYKIDNKQISETSDELNSFVVFNEIREENFTDKIKILSVEIEGLKISYKNINFSENSSIPNVIEKILRPEMFFGRWACSTEANKKWADIEV